MLVWLSLDTWLISLISVGYLLLLIVVAYWGQQTSRTQLANKSWIYSLALGVSCTSWAFYGIIGQASSTGFWLSPLYIGTIAFFILAWPVMLKMLRVSKQQNLTSLADFLASRYDRAPQIAAVVCLIAVLGTVPYISLQLRAISQSFDLVTGSYQSGIGTTFAVTIALIVFSILFGARNIAVNKQNQGLLVAIAFSSIIKLIAISAIGIYVSFFLFDGFSELFNQYTEQVQPNKASEEISPYTFVAQILLGTITIFVTPQLYHMIVIENYNENQLAKARWQYPLYLVLINIFVLPIAIAGQVTFPGGSVNADTYILTLPLYHQQELLSVIVFVGGLAAATGMVIIAAIVLSTMVTTEIITPSVLKFSAFKRDNKTHLATQLLQYRRFTIAFILLLSFIFDRIITQRSDLSSLGLLSFVLLAQFAPAVIAALYWRKVTSKGALTGLIVGAILWFYTLLLPNLFPNAGFVESGLFSINWLKPTELFAITQFDPTAHGTFLSLLFNLLSMVLVSLYSSRSVGEKLQAELFVKKQKSTLTYRFTVEDLAKLLQRFIDQKAAQKLLKQVANTDIKQQASYELVEYTQKQLASVMGTASTKLVMNAALSDEQDETPLALEHVANIVEEANQLFQFNRELLQAGVENIEQGISVVDADMNLVAWNKRYLELLDYPASAIRVGMPVADLIKLNINKGVIKGENPDQVIKRRLEHMQSGNSHYYQRIMPNGIVLEIRGQAMPGGGFVSTFSDITKHIETEKFLQQANEVLELKVQERTQALEDAKAEAVAANASKTRFLAAASHDLMQPFNALSLFTDMLKQQVSGSESEELADHIQKSLTSVEALLSDLVEISKLDSNAQKVEVESFALDEVLQPLSEEIKALALQSSIEFNYIKSSVWVKTDKRLLRRIIQNFLSNAIYYSPLTKSVKAKVTLGVRLKHEQVQIQVWDNGSGIPKNKQQLIFNEFERLESNRDKPGLGLGLTISERIARLLDCKIAMHSTIDKGSMFGLYIDKTTRQQPTVVNEEINKSSNDLSHLNFILIDNDDLLLAALRKQLESWGCQVNAITGRSQIQTLSTEQTRYDFVIADYHLDDDDNGVSLVETIFSDIGYSLPCIICSADPSEALREHCSHAGFSFMKKPVKALALKRLVRQLHKTD